MKFGDIVQIIDVQHPWYPCLLIVDEVKPWGIQAACIIPESNDGSELPVTAWNRLRTEQVVVVGQAMITIFGK
jgi:hypothetical protein